LRCLTGLWDFEKSSIRQTTTAASSGGRCIINWVWFLPVLPVSRKIKAVQVHHLVPGGDEVPHELRLRIGASVDFREGAEIWGNGDWWYVNAAVTGRLVGVINSQGAGVAQPFDSQLGFIGRLGFAPIRTDDGMLEVGVHGSYVARPSDIGGPDTAPGATRYSVTLQERPELRVDGTRLISTGAINAQHASTAGIEAAGQYGPFFLQGEYETYKIERRNGAVGLSDPDFSGYYVEGAYGTAGTIASKTPLIALGKSPAATAAVPAATAVRRRRS